MMTFCYYAPFPSFAAQMPRPLQYHVFQQPMLSMLSPPPQFLAVQHPLSIMMTVSPPPVFALPTPPSLPLTLSILPPGAPAPQISSSKGALKVLFFGHAPDQGDHPLCSIQASWGDFIPSRDGLLAALASWAGVHGLAIRHAGGRIDAAKVKLYVLPRGSSGRPGGLFGMRVVAGEGLEIPGDVVRVVRLDVDEGVWEDALRHVRREGYEAVVVVDMSVSASSDGDGNGDADTTSADATPAAATD
ncbi:hypothetical protein V8C42DRAFT_313784 [Trichoderma barbatum]